MAESLDFDEAAPVVKGVCHLDTDLSNRGHNRCTEVEYVGFGDFSTTWWASCRDSGGNFIRDDNKQKVKFSSKNLNYLRQPKSSQFIEGKNLSWLI